MIKAENILQNRLEYFKNKDYEKIFNIYSHNSEFRSYFESSDKYGEYFNNLVEMFIPESIEIYKDLKENKLVYCYSKSYFVLEEGSWKILKEIRESTLNKGI